MDTYIGTIMLFPYCYAPQDWLECKGQILKASDYPTLFMILGQTYPGGDGKTTFALPDLRDAVPIPNMKYYILVGASGLFPPRPTAS